MIHCNKAWPRRGETGSLPRCWRRGGAKWCSCFEKLSCGSSKSYNKTQKSLFWYMPRRNENMPTKTRKRIVIAALFAIAKKQKKFTVH